MATIIELDGKAPQIAADAYVAPTAVLIGDVTVAAARERVALMLDRSPQAYAAAKRLLWLAASVDLESGMVAEGLAQSLLVGTDEHKRAVEEARWRR